MWGLNLSTEHQVRTNFSDILFDDWINFPNLFRNQTEWPPLLRQWYFMLAMTLNSCFTTFALNHKVDLCLTMTHSAMFANKDAQQIAVCHLLMLSRNHQLTPISIKAGPKATIYMKILIYISYISKMRFLWIMFCYHTRHTITFTAGPKCYEK